MLLRLYSLRRVFFSQTRRYVNAHTNVATMASDLREESRRGRWAQTLSALCYSYLGTGERAPATTRYTHLLKFKLTLIRDGGRRFLTLH